MELGHERLDVYRVALGVARWAASQAIPAARKHLRDQRVRAADSVVSTLPKARVTSRGSRGVTISGSRRLLPRKCRRCSIWSRFRGEWSGKRSFAVWCLC